MERPPRVSSVIGWLHRRLAEGPRPLHVLIGQARAVQTQDGVNPKRQIQVVGAVIVDAGRVLCTQRGSGSLEGLWEFPGGKLEQGESPEEALAREVGEELGCLIKVGARVAVTEHEYDFAVIELTTFYCSLVDGEPKLSEHTALAWLPPDELTTLTWAPADVPAVLKIQSDFA